MIAEQTSCVVTFDTTLILGGAAIFVLMPNTNPRSISISSAEYRRHLGSIIASIVVLAPRVRAMLKGEGKRKL